MRHPRVVTLPVRRRLQTQPHPEQCPLDGEGGHLPFGEHLTTDGEEHGHPVAELVGELVAGGDVDDLDVDLEPGGIALDQSRRLLAERAVGLRDEDGSAAVECAHGGIVAAMRPTTAIAMIVLLVVILGAFIIKAQTSGFTP